MRNPAVKPVHFAFRVTIRRGERALHRLADVSSKRRETGSYDLICREQSRFRRTSAIPLNRTNGQLASKSAVSSATITLISP